MDGNDWFARHVVNGRPRRGITPLNWKGTAVLAGFVLAMTGGGALFLLIALSTRNVLAGAAVFAICVLAGAGTMLWASIAKCQLVTIDPAVPAVPPLRWSAAASRLSFISAVIGGAIAFTVIYLLLKSTLFAALAFILFVIIGAGTTLWAARRADEIRALRQGPRS